MESICDLQCLQNQKKYGLIFLLLEQRKAGTTSLYYYLDEIPGVYMSKVKEPYYFSPHYIQLYPGETVTDKEEYLRLFENTSRDNAVGEASPSYLWDLDSPKLIHQAVPTARIIILLRDPIEEHILIILWMRNLAHVTRNYPFIRT